VAAQFTGFFGRLKLPQMTARLKILPQNDTRNRPLSAYYRVPFTTMKTVLLLAFAAAFSLSGCGGVAIVETPRPSVGYSVHHYQAGLTIILAAPATGAIPRATWFRRAHRSRVIVY